MRGSPLTIMTAITYLSETILLLFLGAGALSDLKTHTIPLCGICTAFFAGIALNLLGAERNWPDVLLGCALGLLLLAVSFLSGQSLGAGDGLTFMVTGSFLGFSGNIWLMLISFALSGIAAICFMIFLKMKGRSSFPFLPFILCGYICLLLMR